MPPIEQAGNIAGQLKDGGLYYICVILSMAVVALFGLLLAAYRKNQLSVERWRTENERRDKEHAQEISRIQADFAEKTEERFKETLAREVRVEMGFHRMLEAFGRKKLKPKEE